MHLKVRNAARSALLIGVVLSIITTALAVWRLLQRDGGATAAHRFVWAHEEAEGWSCDSQVHFDMFVDGRRAWVRCKSADGAHDAIGRIDLDGLGTRLDWPLVGDAHGGQVVGLLPLSDGVAFVLHQETSPWDDVLTIAIAGEEGWELAPVGLPDQHAVFGMAVRDGELEVVTQTNVRREPATLPYVWRVPRSGGPVRREIDADALGCEKKCDIVAAYLHEHEHRWRFVVRHSSLASGPLVDVAEDGTHRVIENVDSSAVDLGDTVVSGVLLQAPFFRSAWRLWPDGRIGPAPHGSRTYYQRDADGRLERLHSWYDGARRMYEIDGRVVVVTPLLADGSEATEKTPWSEYEYLSVADAANPAAIVARVRDCNRLVHGVMVRRGDGHLLLHPDGCHIGLDASLRRSDGRELFEHLRMRGSMYSTWDEPSHAWKLLFVLLGLPVVVAFALALANDRVRTRALVLGVWLQAMLAAWWLRDLWALLR